MSSSKKIVFIVGSLRRNSHNRTLAGYAAEVIGDRADVEYLEYADVPLMNEDIEFPPPPEVVRVREQVEAADAVWIFTPEYNFSYPAGLKNVLDWLSRPQVAANANVRRQLVDLLEYVEASIVGGEGEGFVLPASAWETGVYVIPEWDKTRIALQAEDLLSALS